MTVRIEELEETDGLSARLNSEELPAGESILWQGRPDWWRLAWTAFRLREILIWFALWTGVRAVSGLMGPGPAGQALVDAIAPVLVAAGVAVLIVLGLAALTARSASFTLTERRIVLRHGIALPSQLNIPLRFVQNAELRLHSDGTGDIPLVLPKEGRPFYLQIWPFVRPWHIRAAQPMIRAVPDAEAVARRIARALEKTGGQADPIHMRDRPVTIGEPSAVAA